MVRIFDVDHTVIRGKSAQYFLLQAIEEKYINFWQVRRLPFDMIKYKLKMLDHDFIDNTVENFKGQPESDFEEFSIRCFEKRIRKNIYREAARLINEAQKRGEKVIFATSSFDFIIRPLEKYFGIEGSIATKLEFKDGKTTGKLLGDSLFGGKKKIAVEKWMQENDIKPEETCFYSDSYTDIPLLEYCGQAVAVNPDNRLKREALKRGWEILNFSPRISTN